MTYKQAMYAVTILSILSVWILTYGNMDKNETIKEKNKTIEKLTEELKAGIFVEVFTDHNTYRRIVTRDDSGHIFIPEDQGFTLIIKAR